MKIMLVSVALMIGLSTATLACPVGFRACPSGCCR